MYSNDDTAVVEKKVAVQEPVQQKKSNYRWVIVSLLLFSTTINYMDRNVIGYLKDYFCSPVGFGWSAKDFSFLTSIFTAFYAGFTLFAGFIMDRVGTKKGLAFSLTLWSFAGISSAFMGTGLWLHNAARAIFGAGEAGNFPASIKTVAEWFPKKERALATGMFNSGANIGAMICAIIIPMILSAWNPAEGNSLFFGIFHGWQMAFILTGLVGFIWLIFWKKFYGTPKQMLEKGKVSQQEYDYINSEAETPADPTVKNDAVKAKWYKMLSYKQTWAFVIGKFLTDGIWWFLMFWLPTYISQQFCVGMAPDQAKHTVMLSTFIVYGIAIIGSIYGGSIPMTFMNKGWHAYKARMTAMLIIACAPLLLLTTQWMAGYGIVAAVTIISIGGAAHQAWSANLFTTVSDMFPKKMVGSITGIGAAAGGLGGVFIQLLAGSLEDSYRIKGALEASKAGLIKATDALPLENIKISNLKDVLVNPNMLDQARHYISSNVSVAYGIMFGICAAVYLAAWICMKLLVPKHKPIAG
ncbi:MFS transporter [Pinibacter aurantiacus]|uniref:MFS transporter n=1 Tax=Pinibacter aurantiacus TaxID=2851599 RepID=A0A9E2W873_9BACT|nr:MFS transporter [Pinibacter aurantiacus]MBV4357677.1 MFS transporter [Pinibacter aurantiacus]